MTCRLAVLVYDRLHTHVYVEQGVPGHSSAYSACQRSKEAVHEVKLHMQLRKHKCSEGDRTLWSRLL